MHKQITTQLESAEDKYGLEMADPVTGALLSIPPQRIAESCVRQHWAPALASGMMPPEPTLLQEPLAARVEHGRWLVDCRYCRSAQVTSPNDKRFFCVECANAGQGGWLRVVWPERLDEIESVLLRRMPINRNWSPGETPESLAEENRLFLGREADDLKQLAALGMDYQREEAAAIRTVREARDVRAEARDGGEDPDVLASRSELPGAGRVHKSVLGEEQT